MSWLFSRVLVEEYLGDISSDGELSVQSNGSHTQQAYCSPDKMTDCSRLSRFGMTFKPLTADRGEELLTSYLAAFHAKTFPLRGGGAGIDGERSGMWREMARIIHEVRPRFVFVENSPMLTSRGLGRVLGDLAEMGFDAKWGVLGAADVGAPHQRNRIWIVAYANIKHDALRGNGENLSQDVVGRQGDIGGNVSHSRSGCAESTRESRKMVDSKFEGLERQRCESGKEKVTKSWNASPLADTMSRGLQKSESEPRKEWSKNHASIGTRIAGKSWWETEPDVGRVADGVAARVDRLKAIGNGQVPLCAATAWRILSGVSEV